MSDHSAAMTAAVAQIAQLRLSGLTLAAMIEKGLLSPAQAAALVDDAAQHLRGEHLSEQVLAQYREAYRQVRQDLLAHQRR